MTYDITFEEGTDGATISVGGGVASVTSTPVYTTSTVSEGAVAMLVSSSTATSCIRTVLVTDTTHTIAFDFRRNSAISVDTRFASWGNAANTTTTCNLKFKFSTNTIAITNQSTTDMVATTVALPLNTWARIEAQYNNTNTAAPVVTLRFYANKNDAIANYAEEISVTLTGTTNIFDRHNFGVLGSGSGTRAFYFDNIRKRPGLNWIGPVVNAVEKIGTDTWAMVISEARTLDVFVGGSDTAAIAATESRTIEASLSRTDTAGLTSTESRELAAHLQAADTSAVSSTESRTIAADLSRTDTGSLSISESRSQEVSLTRSDTSGLTINESRSVIAFLTRNDTGSLSITETKTLANFISAVDSGSISIVEANNLSVEIARTDSFTISISEQGSLAGTQQLRVYWDGMWRTGVLRIYQDGEWYPITIHFRKDNTWS